MATNEHRFGRLYGPHRRRTLGAFEQRCLPKGRSWTQGDQKLAFSYYLYLPTHQDEEIIADGILSNNHVPRLIRAHVHDVEDFDEFMRIAEAKQADVFQRLDFPRDGDTRFAPCALDSVNLHGNNSNIVVATAYIRHGDTARHQVPQGQARAHLRQLLLTCEIVMEAIRAKQEAIMGHTFDE